MQQVPLLIPSIYYSIDTPRPNQELKDTDTQRHAQTDFTTELKGWIERSRPWLLAGGDTGLGALGGALAVRRERAALAAEQLLLVALLLGEATLALLLALLAAPFLLPVLAAPRRALVVALRGHAAARLLLKRPRQRVLLRPDGRQRRALRGQQARGFLEVRVARDAPLVLLARLEWRGRRRGGAGRHGEREEQ
jgi:hypothetical protein